MPAGGDTPSRRRPDPLHASDLTHIPRGSLMLFSMLIPRDE